MQGRLNKHPLDALHMRRDEGFFVNREEGTAGRRQKGEEDRGWPGREVTVASVKMKRRCKRMIET